MLFNNNNNKISDRYRINLLLVVIATLFINTVNLSLQIINWKRQKNHLKKDKIENTIPTADTTKVSNTTTFKM